MRGKRELNQVLGIGGMACGLWLGVALSSSAAVIQVPDTERGIETIQDGIGRSHPGDMILVAPGIYNESLVITTSSLTLGGLGNVVIHHLSPPVLLIQGTDDIHLHNLILTNGSPGIPRNPIDPVPSDQEPVMVMTNSSATLTSCTVRASNSPGIEVTDSRLWLENVESRGSTGKRAGIRATNSQLWLKHVSSHGVSGSDGDYGGSINNIFGEWGGHGVFVTGGCISATTCTLTGGAGGDGATQLGFGGSGGNGGSGCVLENGVRADFTGCVMIGAKGGRGHSGLSSGAGGNGGDGVTVQTLSRALLTQCSGSGASGGWGTPVGADGQLFSTDGSSRVTELPALADQTACLLGSGGLTEGERQACDLNADAVFDVGDLVAQRGFCGAVIP